MDERLYTIPLGKAYEAPTVKRANRAVTILREYITKHAKVSNVGISGMLNRYLWKGSRKHPPRNVKIKVIKDGDKAMAYLPEEKMEEKKKEAKKEAPKKAEEKPKEEKKEAPKEEKKPEVKEEKKPEPKKEEPRKEESKEEKPKEESKEEKKEMPKEETSKEQKK